MTGNAFQKISTLGLVVTLAVATALAATAIGQSQLQSQESEEFQNLPAMDSETALPETTQWQQPPADDASPADIFAETPAEQVSEEESTEDPAATGEEGPLPFRTDRLEVEDSTCEKAFKRFHEEARRTCIRYGKQLENATPKTCDMVSDMHSTLEKAVYRGTIRCETRM